MKWLLGVALVVVLVLVLGFRARAGWRRSVRQQVLGLLRETQPQATVVKENEDSLEVRLPDGTGGTIGLQNLFTRLAMERLEPAAQREAIREFIGGVMQPTAEAAQPLSLSVHGARLLPRLADSALLQQASTQGMPLVHRTTSVSGLVVVYVLDSEQSVMYLDESRLAELQLTANELHERALANLGRQPIREAVRGVVERRQVAMLKLGDSFDATRLLLVPQHLDTGEELVAVIPDRETLGLLPMPGESGWGAVRKLARTPASPYRLIDRPLRVTREGFTLA